DFVGSWELYKFGPATKTNEKRSLAHESHDVAARRAAKDALLYAPVRFNETQRAAIACGFGNAVKEGNYQIYALCIGHDHAHAVVARHQRTIEQVARHMKSKATMELTRRGIHPLQACHKNDGLIPTPWAAACWSVFVDDPEQ